MEIIHSFQGFETAKNNQAFAKFVGLAPTQHQSDTLVRGQSQIHRASQTDLRQKLYMPLVSLCTKKQDKHFQTILLQTSSKRKIIQGGTYRSDAQTHQNQMLISITPIPIMN